MQIIFPGNKTRKYVFVGLLAVMLLLNVLAWSSTAFCDWYIGHVFPIWVNTYGRLTGLFPFSVGEWMIVAGVILVAVALGMVPWLLLFGTLCLIRRRPICRRFFGFAKYFYRAFAWILLAVSIVMTLNCFILYHASTFSENYFPEQAGKTSEDYSTEDLLRLYNLVVTECNRLSETVQRDEEGRAVYSGDMQQQARLSMQRLGAEYPRLDGWYPRPKLMFFSDFMCQQYMEGYYFPFSMEANINQVMELMNRPSAMCHELAHLRGYIFEDEANFISYLACIQSGDDTFVYSGYLSVLYYVYRDVEKALKQDPTILQQCSEELKPVGVKEIVWQDAVFVSEEEWDRINGKALIDTETVDKASDVFIDTNLKVNGVADGSISYSRVVLLLLQYYSDSAKKN